MSEDLEISRVGFDGKSLLVKNIVIGDLLSLIYFAFRGTAPHQIFVCLDILDKKQDSKVEENSSNQIKNRSESNLKVINFVFSLLK